MDKVQIYEPIDRGQVHAVLWNGKMSDLVGMPEFNSLVEMVSRIDSTGLLILQLGGNEVKVASGRHYITYSPNGWFNVVDEKVFRTGYQAIPAVLPREK